MNGRAEGCPIYSEERSKSIAGVPVWATDLQEAVEPAPCTLSDMTLSVVATCAAGLEQFLAGELAELGFAEPRPERGAVIVRGSWRDVWRANWRLRTANRVAVELLSWPAPDGDAVRSGMCRLVGEELEWDGLSAAELFYPSRTFAIRATTSRSAVRDVRWAALRAKDGLVDAQRSRFGSRSNVDRNDPDVALRLRLDRNRATALLDTTGVPLDRRGYRLETGAAPVREQLAAACVLAAGDWEGTVVVDPMCGTGTLLAECGWIGAGVAPGSLRTEWAFTKLPGFDPDAFEAVRREPIPSANPDVRLVGSDSDRAVVRKARANLDAAGLGGRVTLAVADAFTTEPPAGPGLVVVNPPYGKRSKSEPEQWRRLGDLLKQRYGGWRAVVLAGDVDRGKWIGLKPLRRWPVRNGPLEARILVFDLY